MYTKFWLNLHVRVYRLMLLYQLKEDVREDLLRSKTYQHGGAIIRTGAPLPVGRCTSCLLPFPTEALWYACMLYFRFV